MQNHKVVFLTTLLFFCSIAGAAEFESQSCILVADLSDAGALLRTAACDGKVLRGIAPNENSSLRLRQVFERLVNPHGEKICKEVSRKGVLLVSCLDSAPSDSLLP